MTRKVKLVLAATLLSGLAAACLDSGVAPRATTPSLGSVSAAVTCQVTVRTATLACGPATPVATNGVVHEKSGVEADVLTLGGQGIYVQLTSSGTVYDGSSVFTSDVTLTNLSVFAMNTADGTTADTGGVKVFFNTGPSVTGGTGTVTVENPDGTGTFTATDQPFFKYSSGALLYGGVQTPSKTWQFTVPPTVTGFAFTVYVTSQLPVTTGLTFAQVSAGADYACGVTTAGAAYCWGDGFYGQLGNGRGGGAAPWVAVAGGYTFAAVSAGGFFACGVTTAGLAYCWGNNVLGSLGNGTTTNSTTPVQVAGPLTFAAVSAGNRSACGVTAVGAFARCWGDNSYGELGNGTTTNSTTPGAVSGGLTFASVSTQYDSACGVTTAGAAYCWGDNSSGQLGNGTKTKSTTPVAVAGGLTFATVSAGQYFACGVTTKGAAYCWGNNSSGQLGNGIVTNSSTPVRVW